MGSGVDVFETERGGWGCTAGWVAEADLCLGIVLRQKVISEQSRSSEEETGNG